MKQTLVVLLSFFSLNLWADGFMGGGGTPIADPGVNFVKASGNIDEFVYWEKSQRIAYRTDKKNIRLIDLASGAEENLGAPVGNLAAVLDPFERFLVSANPKAAIYDLIGQKKWFLLSKNAVKPWFWVHDEIYSLVQKENAWSLHRANGTTMMGLPTLCQNVIERVTHHALPVEGVTFPHADFYRIGRDEVSIFRVDLRECHVKEVARMDRENANILGVFYLASLDAHALWLDRPRENLLWSGGYNRKRFSVPTQRAFLLSSQRPWMAFSGDDGTLRLIDFSKEKVLTPLDGKVPFYGPAQTAYLSSDERHLFFASSFSRAEARENKRWLMRVDLRPQPSSL